ncbi:vacuolar protein sorting 55 [Dictyocaulus viviparus]|uniref:Vacuolar protein sorting 55 n=1 Tax=Dictyocaulus viviparus TaxID=29172 RepID=A0A0D8Y3D7_DICVI|nr:vacuolar protein sorting 55 [Dictyocaulus viviparus]
MGGVRAVAALAFAGVLGLTLLVLGCGLPMFGVLSRVSSSHFRNWSPMFVVAFYVLAPVPLMIARHFQQDMTGTSACVELALFITTAIVVSAFALPTVLAHAGTNFCHLPTLISVIALLNKTYMESFFNVLSTDINQG